MRERQREGKRIEVPFIRPKEVLIKAAQNLIYLKVITRYTKDRVSIVGEQVYIILRSSGSDLRCCQPLLGISWAFTLRFYSCTDRPWILHSSVEDLSFECAQLAIIPYRESRLLLSGESLLYMLGLTSTNGYGRDKVTASNKWWYEYTCREGPPLVLYGVFNFELHKLSRGLH